MEVIPRLCLYFTNRTRTTLGPKTPSLDKNTLNHVLRMSNLNM